MNSRVPGLITKQLWNGWKWDLQTWTINRYTYRCWTFPMSDLDGYGLKFKAQQKPEMDGSFWDFTWFYLSSLRSLIHPPYGCGWTIWTWNTSQFASRNHSQNRMPKLRLGLGLNLQETLGVQIPDPTRQLLVSTQQPGPQQNTSDLGEVGYQVAQKSLLLWRNGGIPKNPVVDCHIPHEKLVFTDTPFRLVTSPPYLLWLMLGCWAAKSPDWKRHGAGGAMAGTGNAPNHGRRLRIFQPCWLSFWTGI